MTPAAKRRQRRRLKAEALERENAQLRRLMGDVLDDGAHACDPFGLGWCDCECSTARARRVLAGEPEWPA